MPFNVMIQLCKITRASKLFQRNFYLPLLKPLSPKDALRQHFVTGKNILEKIEHYIPVLEEYKARVQRRKHMRKGVGKKRQRKKESKKYLSPFFDESMEGHSRLKALLSTKSKGKGQCYTYYIPDKKCTLVISRQMERAVRDKDIIDILVAQRSEKIVVVLKDNTKITLPLAPYKGEAPFYRGEGWTKKEIEESHHHGRETMTVVKIFEARESGVEEWELEMMRMAAKRKRQQKGEETADWKAMMNTTMENMDWEEFEEEAKQIVEQADEVVEDEPIPMAVDNMDKTKNVIEKLKNAGEDILSKLPVMPEIPEIISTIKEHGDLTEIADVSGVTVNLKSSDKERFVPGQMIKSEEGEIFVPGQTVTTDAGVSEYTPGFTVLLDNEPTLIPGLVMGNDPNKAMFLPGESTITKGGELQFTETEEDVIKIEPTSELQREEEEVELEEEQNSEDEEEEMRPPPPPKRQPKEFVYEVPKRQYTEYTGPKHRERKEPKKKFVMKIDWNAEPKANRFSDPIFYDLTTAVSAKDLLLQQKQRVSEFSQKKSEEEITIEKKRRAIRLRARQLMECRPIRREYIPFTPVRKSEKLTQLEMLIKTGAFFDIDYRKYLSKRRHYRFNWLEPHDYRLVYHPVGIMRHRVWKSVF